MSLSHSEPCADTEPTLPKPSAKPLTCDVAVVGAGIAGAATALVLEREGYSVVVIDGNSECPPDFRCEKLTGQQIKLFDDVGLASCLDGVGSKVTRVTVVSDGAHERTKGAGELCLRYEMLVNAVRRSWPKSLKFILGSVASIANTADRQTLTLDDGTVIDTRLVVLATGRAEKLRAGLGVTQETIRRNQSICFAFDLAAPNDRPRAFQALTYHGEQVGDHMAFVSIFPMGGVMRANLFAYRLSSDPWTKEFRQDPMKKMFEAMPGLARHLEGFTVVSPVDVRLIHLMKSANVLHDGVVLIGDAFRMSCPVTGSGVTRVMTDVGRLTQVHIPRWLKTPGMSAAKMAEFYADDVKRLADKRSAGQAERLRRYATSTDLRWRLRRRARSLRDRVLAAMTSSGRHRTATPTG